MLENHCRIVKGASGARVLMKSTVMTKFKRDLDLKDVLAIEPTGRCERVAAKFKFLAKRL